jgi:hypothetical protein
MNHLADIPVPHPKDPETPMPSPDDRNLFGGLEPELRERIKERMPQKVGAKRAAMATLGLLVMIAGGLGLVAGVLCLWFANISAVVRDFPREAEMFDVASTVLMVAGPLSCTLGYWLWRKASDRPRRDGQKR